MIRILHDAVSRGKKEKEKKKKGRLLSANSPSLQLGYLFFPDRVLFFPSPSFFLFPAFRRNACCHNIAWRVRGEERYYSLTSWRSHDEGRFFFSFWRKAVLVGKVSAIRFFPATFPGLEEGAKNRTFKLLGVKIVRRCFEVFLSTFMYALHSGRKNGSFKRYLNSLKNKSPHFYFSGSFQQ